MASGEPRATLDIDVVVRLAPTDLERLKARFPSEEFYLDVEAAGEATVEGSQFNIIHPSSGLKIGVFVEADEIEHVQIEDRRRLPALPGFTAAFSRGGPRPSGNLVDGLSTAKLRRKLDEAG